MYSEANQRWQTYAISSDDHMWVNRLGRTSRRGRNVTHTRTSRVCPHSYRSLFVIFPSTVERSLSIIQLCSREIMELYLTPYIRRHSMTRRHWYCNGPTNAFVCNKTLIQMSHIKTLKITPTCFDHQLIMST
jgi:hypothetical protein